MSQNVEVFIGAERVPSYGQWLQVDPDPEVTNDRVKRVAAHIAERFGGAEVRRLPSGVGDA
jgi:hypothetical protein